MLKIAPRLYLVINHNEVSDIENMGGENKEKLL